MFNQLAAVTYEDALAWLMSSRVKLAIAFVVLVLVFQPSIVVWVGFGVVVALIFADTLRPFRDKVADFLEKDK